MGVISRSGTSAPSVPAPAHAGSALLRLVGADIDVPLADGSFRRAVNLDFAASTPALEAVEDAMAAVLPWYSSVHRGAGMKSQVMTAAYEGARDEVRSFFHARPDDAVIFTRNATDSINMLSCALPTGTRVIGFAIEHHANLLPWRRHEFACLPIPESPEAMLASLDAGLRAAGSRPILVAVTGASNVTGEIWPLREIIERAHRFGARVFVDAAQLAPHHPIDVSALDVDYLAMSGHKIYAPYGAGVLLGRADWLESQEPYLRGGGAVEFVTLDEVLWKRAPEREEAGSPNVLGAIALGVACRTLGAFGMAALAREETELHRYARSKALSVPGLEVYELWEPDHPRLAIVTFNLQGYDYRLLAAVLSAEYGIGVRHGCFCAHPLLLHLLHVELGQADAIRDELRQGRRHRVPGAVRMSFGLGVTRDEIDYACSALARIAADGPRFEYVQDAATGEFSLAGDTRVWPTLPVSMAREAAHAFGDSS
jgi:selenocysteine lyase/cysteine desulfurase